jgi:L-2-hydroxyglutarate oxidase LhgO
MTTERIGVVGAGIVGLAVAARLAHLRPDAEVTVVEKEPRIAAHQTGRNSGVVHAGIYYPPGSLKALLCRRGVALLREYCRERGIAYEESGKLVIARSEAERPALERIRERAQANGVPDVAWVGPERLREIEPHAVGVAAVHSPRTAITDFPAVAQALADDVGRAGGTLRLSFQVRAIEQRVGGIAVSDGRDVSTFDRLVICGGLHTDRLARRAGDDAGPRIVPFRGEYYALIPQRAELVRGLIYPVPDPAYPFLGVHFTRRIDGTVDVGPNAVLALAREGYLRREVSLRDLGETLAWPGFRRLARRHWRMGLSELVGSASRRVFLDRARAYVPELSDRDVVRAPAGIRAQAVDRDGSLVEDFRIHEIGAVTAIRNAPSPGATSSLAIAEHVAERVLAPRPG